jgi:uncharacterized protein YbjQ (UPF0145 family)
VGELSVKEIFAQGGFAIGLALAIWIIGKGIAWIRELYDTHTKRLEELAKEGRREAAATSKESADAMKAMQSALEGLRNTVESQGKTIATMDGRLGRRGTPMAFPAVVEGKGEK